MTTRTPETKCLRCGHKLDAASNPKDDSKTPSPGDITICMYCGYIMTFTNDMTLREPTNEELREAPLDEIARIQRARRMVMDPD